MKNPILSLKFISLVVAAVALACVTVVFARRKIAESHDRDKNVLSTTKLYEAGAALQLVETLNRELSDSVPIASIETLSVHLCKNARPRNTDFDIEGEFRNVWFAFIKCCNRPG